MYSQDDDYEEEEEEEASKDDSDDDIIEIGEVPAPKTLDKVSDLTLNHR